MRYATIRLGGMWHDLILYPDLTLELEPRRLRNVDLAGVPWHMTKPGSSWLTEHFVVYLELACGTLLEPEEQLLIAALNRLAAEHPATYRAVALHAADAPYAEIAARLDCTQSTARWHVHRGKRYLEDIYAALQQNAASEPVS